MKKQFLTVAMIMALTAGVSLQSCIGSFALTNKLLAWNNTISNKFVNEVVFFAFLIVPVYEVSAIADLLVLNSIEFWSGSSPVAKAEPRIIEGNDSKYLVETTDAGYTITNLADGSVSHLNFNAINKSWSVQTNGQEYPLIAFVDDKHVSVPTLDGKDMVIELSDDGLYAYQHAILCSDLALNK